VHIGCISICHAYKNPSKNNLAYDALHDMAHYNFLNSSRSLEEFRKNPHVKIPHKSPCTNFQIPCKFKNLIFILKGNFLQFSTQSAQSACLAFQPTRPFLPPSPMPAERRHFRTPPCPGRRAALLPRHGETTTVAPPPSSIGWNHPLLHSGNGSIEDAIYHYCPTYSAHLCRPPDPIKGCPYSGRAPHPFTSPPPFLSHTHTIVT
jgi:hypothetical protein